MDKHQFAGLIRSRYPQYSQQSDDWIVEQVRKVALAPSTPGAQQIYSFLKAHQVSVGLISGFFQRALTKQQADTLEHALRAAKALNETDMALRSSYLGIPRERLGDYLLNEQSHDQTIHLETRRLTLQKDLETHKTALQKELIDHDTSKKAELADREAQSELHNAQAFARRIDVLIDEIAKLEGEPPNKSRDEKIAFRRKALKAAQKEYHERFGG